MMLYCAHCRRNYPRGDFDIKRRDRRRLWNGSRVASVIHRKCKLETEYPEAQALEEQSRITATR
jgi:hypothetical protein